jgi:tetratricopeptide (TPR) repeat protein
MFFPKLRRHAKWMFVLLALVFAGGFVVFGVGSDQGTGIGDILRNSGGNSSGGPSVSDAQKRLEQNPKDAEAQRDLATALQADGKTTEAIAALERYTQLRPKEDGALRELAGLYLAQANQRQLEAQNAQIRAGYLNAAGIFSEPLSLGKDITLGQDPITAAITTEANEALQRAYTSAQASYASAEKTYERLVKAAPNDPNVQLELAQVAQQSGDVAKAISAYERFLVLAPDDPSASIVRQQIAQLKAQQTPAASG